jgi:hypothetical protein
MCAASTESGRFSRRSYDAPAVHTEQSIRHTWAALADGEIGPLEPGPDAQWRGRRRTVEPRRRRSRVPSRLDSYTIQSKVL